MNSSFIFGLKCLQNFTKEKTRRYICWYKDILFGKNCTGYTIYLTHIILYNDALVLTFN